MHRTAACNGQWFTVWSDGSAVTVHRCDDENTVEGTEIGLGLAFADAIELIKTVANGDEVHLGQWRLSGRPEELPMRPERL